MTEQRQRLPNRRSSLTFNFEFEGHLYKATASRFANGKLGEIFLDCGKPNTPLQLNAETAAVLTSLLLQHGVSEETIRHSVNGPIRTALELAGAP